MHVFQYLTFLCDQTRLQDLLTQHGLESWRLHTCEPVMAIGPSGGSGTLQILVVLDRVTVSEEEEVAVDEPASEGLEMKS